VCFQRRKLRRAAFDGESERPILRFRNHWHRHVGETVAGEDIQRRAVGIYNEALPAVAERGGGAVVIDDEFLLRRVVGDFNTADVECDRGVR